MDKRVSGLENWTIFMDVVCVSSLMKKFKKLLNKHDNIFLDKKFKYLKEADYNTCNLYTPPMLLKKVLKSLTSTSRTTR